MAAKTCSREFYDVVLRPLVDVRQSERVDLQCVQRLARSIVREGRWLEPIVVERASGIVMDGNHRFTVAKVLGFETIPCIELDYDDPRVCVHDWRTGACFDVRKIFDTLNRGEIFPYKTTRHTFSPVLPKTSVHLGHLAPVST
ncbi:ParB N-terminal domain-containing protein [Pseudomonas sp. M30-35]|uniref:ParB N-terminal domain-containing protein n=1 Tax=Pseudomonas sp. M30-35 TaxID=1981174 RepID=UPI0021159637|nr:ParB N-terminal domain-containing protein [Pseudomonas sp. M30-35]